MKEEPTRIQDVLLPADHPHVEADIPKRSKVTHEVARILHAMCGSY